MEIGENFLQFGHVILGSMRTKYPLGIQQGLTQLPKVREIIRPIVVREGEIACYIIIKINLQIEEKLKVTLSQINTI